MQTQSMVDVYANFHQTPSHRILAYPPESDLFFKEEVVLEEAHEAEIREVLAEESFGTVMEAFAVALEAAEEVTEEA